MNTQWIRGGLDTDKPLWGLRSGIQVAIWPASVEDGGNGGPRGLFRIGVPMKNGGKEYGLINFVAVEPIVKGQRGFSELEPSRTDGRPGKLFWTGSPDGPGEKPDPGTLTKSGGVERLTVTVHVEQFANGARPIVELQIASDRPDEVRFTVRAARDSAPMEYCVLTATMGNYARLRRLWLADGVVEPKNLWPNFSGDEFTPEAFFPLERLPRTSEGDVLVCATSDEKEPWTAPVDPRGPGWHYRGDVTFTQYWRKPKDAFKPDLRVRVNGRRVYWASHNPIPGGLAYENFDMVEKFYDGQVFIFGVTRKTPQDLGVAKKG